MTSLVIKRYKQKCICLGVIHNLIQNNRLTGYVYTILERGEFGYVERWKSATGEKKCWQYWVAKPTPHADTFVNKVCVQDKSESAFKPVLKMMWLVKKIIQI